MITSKNDPLSLLPASKYTPPTEVVDNIKAGFRQEFNENHSLAPWLTEKEDLAVRDRRIYEAADSGLFPESILKAANRPNKARGSHLDTSFLSQWAADNIPELYDIDTDSKIRERTKELFGAEREEDVTTMMNATLGGKAGQFLGALGANITDPVYLPSFFLGVGAAAQSARILSVAGKAAAAGAAVEGGLEAVKQIQMHDWRLETGADHSLSHALTRIGMAAGMGAGISAISSSAAHVVLNKFIKGMTRDLAPDDVWIPKSDYQHLLNHAEDLATVNTALGRQADEVSYFDGQKKLYDKEAEINSRHTAEPEVEIDPKELSDIEQRTEAAWQRQIKEDPETEGFTEKFLDEETPETRKATDIIEEIDTDIDLLTQAIDCVV